MKSCLIIMVIISTLIFTNIYCSAEPQQIYRYWTCYNKKSKIDSKYDERYCINRNTYMNENNDKCMVIASKGDKTNIFIDWNKNVGYDMIEVKTKVDSKEVNKLPWNPKGKIIVHMAPFLWYKLDLKDGENLIIRVESYDGSFPEEEAEFDIGGINEAWNYVSKNVEQ